MTIFAEKLLTEGNQEVDSSFVSFVAFCCLMIAITFALRVESSKFLGRLNNQTRIDRNGICIIRGKIDNREIEVLHTGVGEKICRERLAKFLQNQQFDCLISAGFAGALTDDFRVCDLLLAKNFSTIDLNEKRSSFSSLQIHVADLLTASALIDSSDERKKIARTSDAVAVDMETEFIARICAKRGIPLLSLRVITDAPGEPFPAPPNILFDVEQQRTRMAMLAKFLLGHPTQIPRLIRFARRIARARKTLANALVAVATAL